MDREVRLWKMTWPEVRDRLKESQIALVCVGSTEAHGLHLSLDADTIVPFEIARRAAEKVFDEVKPVIAPPIPYGYQPFPSINHFPGTIGISSQTLKQLVKEVCASLIQQGFKKIVILDGHGGDGPAIQIAMWELADETDAYIAKVDWWGGFGGDIIRQETESHTIIHACETETSVAWACGARVLIERAVKVAPASPSRYVVFDTYAAPPVVSAVGKPLDWFNLTNGVSGLLDPTLASVEKGERIVSAIVDRLADFLRELKTIAV